MNQSGSKRIGKGRSNGQKRTFVVSISVSSRGGKEDVQGGRKAGDD
jgi:hypothetical protein